MSEKEKKMKIIQTPTIISQYLSQFNIQEKITSPQNLSFQLRYYNPGETILKEGNKLDGIYFQVTGRTKVTSSIETGKSLLLRFCHPHAIFGDIELLQKIEIQSQVEAVEETSLLFLDKLSVELYLMKDPLFLGELSKHLSYKLQTCTTASRVNLLATVEARFASYLLTTRDIHNHFGKEITTNQTEEIASLIGTTHRHLNRIILSFLKKKIIKKEKKILIVLDWGFLEELSNGVRYE